MEFCLVISEENSNSCTVSAFEYWVDNIDSPRYSAFRTGSAIAVLVILLLAIMALGSVWHYERYGGDPQKRTLLNQLVGQSAFTIMICLMVALSAMIFRLTNGPMSAFYAVPIFFIPNFICATTLLLSLNEIILFRFLTIVWWKHLPPIHDNFFGWYLTCSNYGIALLFASMGQLAGDPDDNIFFVMTGVQTHDDSSISTLT